MDFERLRSKVIEENYPEEEELEEVKDVYRKVSEFVKEKFDLETHFAGSSGRGTCLSDDKDIDIFLMFPEETERNEMEEEGLRIGKKIFEEFEEDCNVDYAEHPYTKGMIEGFEVEIIPCIDVEKGDLKSSVDRTPYHSEWVNDKLNEEQKKDVVVLKKFLKSQGLYGSSLRNRGFSGYLCEVLIGDYGSFEEVVNNSKNWKKGEIIDTENHLSGEQDCFETEHLIVVDPVDEERNVASVLSIENYAKYIYSCLEFTDNPGMDFFRDESLELDKFELNQEIDRRADIIVIEFENIDEVDDIVYPQMRKTVRRLENILKDEGFRLYRSGFHIGEKTRILFEIDSGLPEVKVRDGPKVFHDQDDIRRFRENYDNVFVEGERLKAKTERDYSRARDFLKDFLEDELGEKGIPSNVAEKLSDYSFVDPMTDGDQEWLKYLANKFNLS